MKIPNRLLIFTDPGLDDAMAIIYLLREIPKEVRIDIICVGGNNDATKTFRNACSLINSLARKDIFIWKTDCINQRYECLESIHGDNFPGLCNHYYANAFIYPDDWREIREDCSFLILAACTIPNRVKIQDDNIEQIIVMGGGVSQINHNDLEYNQAMDPIAFSNFVKKHESKIRMITIDSCRQDIFNIYNSNYNQVLLRSTTEYKLYDTYCNLAIQRQSKYCIPYDLIAAFALLNPEMIIYEKQELIGIKDTRPYCMTGSTINETSDFWKLIWRF